MSETKSRGGRKALEPGELGNYTITGYRADGTATTKSASYYSARAWVGLEYGGRKRVQVRGASRTEVRRLMSERAEALAEEDREQGAAAQSSIPATWGAAVQNHRAYITGPLANKGRGYSEASKRVYLSAIDTYLLGDRCPFAEDRRLSSVKRGHLEEWLAAIANSTEKIGKRRIGGEGAAKTVRAVVQGIYARAERADVVKVNPTRGLEFERSRDLKRTDPKDRNHRRAFTAGELAHLYEVADADARSVRNDVSDLVRFLIGTGCRIGEALALSWDHVDLGTVPATVTIASTASRVAGEGIKLGRTKTEKSERTLELPASLTSILRERYARMTDAKHERPLLMGEERLVFPSSVGTIRDQSNVNATLRHLFDAAGLSWATTHTCRSTTANLLDSAGYTPREIAARLGNSVETLMRHYFDAESTPEGMADALEKALTGTDPAEKVDTEVDIEASKPVLSMVKAG